MRESAAERRARAGKLLRRLATAYPGAGIELDWSTPLQLLVATILSAQCTDERVNNVTRTLFPRYGTAEALARAEPARLEAEIRPTGFYRAKTRALIGMARALVDRHGGEVPRTLEALTALPGVGRKTANVVLGNAFNINEGVVVDTHVTRLSQRLGLTKHTDAVKIEHDLIPLIPREDWTIWSHLLIYHGRKVCTARNPACETCPLRPHCPSAEIFLKARAEKPAAKRSPKTASAENVT